MKQVWKCDFCSKTGKSTDIEAHEPTCSFNPAARHCYTCKHQYEDGAPIGGFYYMCAKGVECTDMDEVNMNKLVCDKYEAA